jgi:hypothetical protein
MFTSPQSLQQYLSTHTPAELAEAKSCLADIFRANPSLSIIYPGGPQILAPNSSNTNNLQPESVNFTDLDSKGTNSMPLTTNVRLCTHIKVNGVPCGSPALRGEVFCYFHQRMFRGVRTPANSRLHPVALIEDELGIQAALMEVINALVRNTVDFPRAQLILRALHIAVRNSPRAHFDGYESEMVREIPNYPAPPEKKPPSPALMQAGALALVGRRKPTNIASLPEVAGAADTLEHSSLRSPA